MFITGKSGRGSVAATSWIVMGAVAALALSACGGSSSSSSSKSGDPLAGKVLQLQGGNGEADGGSGGDGYCCDSLDIDSEGAGDVIVGGKGGVDASFKAFNLNTLLTELGENPLEVNADLVVSAVADPANKPGADTFYLQGDGINDRLMKSDGDTSAFNAVEEVTGVHVAQGATLTLEPNDGTSVLVFMDHDLIIQGTLTTDNAGAPADMNWHLSTAVIHGSGVVAQQGTSAGQDGGRAGFYPDISFINHGSILTHGADNDAGDAGDGGIIYVDAGFITENTGDLISHGGESTDGAGGDGGYIRIYSDMGESRARGRIHAYGGAGTTAGGDGDDITLDSSEFGNVLVSAQVWGYGGDTEDGDAGDADYFDSEASGGAIYVNADVRLYGGSASSLTGNGGDAGDVDLDSDDNDFDCCEEARIYGVHVRGDRINLSGGHAHPDGSGDGGEGGEIEIELDPYDVVQLDDKPVIRLVGFGRIDAYGGSGSFGGAGGEFDFDLDEENNENGMDIPPGNLIVRAVIDASGGDVVENSTVAGEAGDGGYVDAESEYAEASISRDLAGNVRFRAIDISAGMSLDGSSTSDAGDLDIEGYNSVTLGRIDAFGGDDRGELGGTQGYGNHGGDVDVIAFNGRAKTGGINVNGGDGLYEGGDAGDVMVEGLKVALGSVTLNGGDADPANGGSTGGDAGDLYAWGPSAPVGVSVANWSSAAGSGDTEGSEDRYVLIGASCNGTACNTL